MPNRRPRTPQIEDDVTVGAMPAPPDGQGGTGTPGTDIQIVADPSQQYTAGTTLQWYQNFPRSLSFAIDSVTSDFGYDLYFRMLNDSQVRSVVNVLKSSIIENGLEITSAIEDKTDPDFAQAVDLADRATEMLDNLNPALDDVLWDMLDAIALGNRMAEQVFALDTTMSGRREYTLKSLAVKPSDAVAFVTDVYLNVLGILARVPGQPFTVQQGMLLTDIQHTTNFLPRSKFAVLTFRPRNGDPRGTSILRSAFTAWNSKVQLHKEWLKYLSQFASPSLVGFTADEAVPYQVHNADGTLAVDSLGNPLVRTPEDDMVAALQAFANGTATAFPFGAKVQPVEMVGTGTPFLDAFSFLDRQITKAVLNQTLATEESEHQTRASTGTHKDVLDTITRQCKRPVERMFSRDVLGTWMRLNGEENLMHLRPHVSLGTASTEDFAALWTATAALHRANYLHSSQYAELDRDIGLPERDPPDATSIPMAESVMVKEDAGVVSPPAEDGTDDGTEPPDAVTT